MLRVFEEFLWTLRRHGLRVSASQAADVSRVAMLLGYESRDTLREALALVVVQRRDERPRFDALFDSFFLAEKAHPRDLFGRLGLDGFDRDVTGRLRDLLRALASSGDDASAQAARALLEAAPGLALDSQLASAGIAHALEGLHGERQVGFFFQQLLGKLGLARATGELAMLRALLEGEFGPEAGAALFVALRRELELARREVRLFVEERARERSPQGARGSSGPASAEEIAEVRRATRVLGEKLRGAARVRARRRRRGRVDAHRTLRAAMRTGGVPMRLCYRKKQRQRPRLWILCDVSESVRETAIFLLEFVAVTQELFERTRSFVFVSELVETTRLFERSTTQRALDEVLGGRLVNTTHNSNYGRALRQFEERHGREIDRRSTVVIVGDGRTHFQRPEEDIVERLRERARSVLWLCPEPASRWGTGDSAMPRYARAVTEVLAASTASELEAAARRMLRR